MIPNDYLPSLIIDSLNNPIVLIDKNKNIISYNPEWVDFCKNLGIEEEQIRIGENFLNPWSKIVCSCMNIKEMIEQNLSEVLSGYQAQYIFEYFCVASPNTRLYKLISKPLIGNQNKLFLMHIHEITQLKLSEQLPCFSTSGFEKKEVNNIVDLEKNVSLTEAQYNSINKDDAKLESTISNTLKYRDRDIENMQNAISFDLEATVIPLLSKLKSTSYRRRQTIQLIDSIETNLNQTIQTYGRDSNLRTAFQKLTSIEIRVASMVKQGLRTKTIATTLDISSETVNTHRKRIRKKLGLNSKSINLYCYLVALVEPENDT